MIKIIKKTHSIYILLDFEKKANVMNSNVIRFTGHSLVIKLYIWMSYSEKQFVFIANIWTALLYRIHFIIRMFLLCFNNLMEL